MNSDYKIKIYDVLACIDKDYQFIDLRNNYEFKKQHIKNFINIPYDSFDIDKYYLSKNKKIVLICYSGKRSLDLAKKLQNIGYDAYSVEGGYYALLQKEKEDYPL